MPEEPPMGAAAALVPPMAELPPKELPEEEPKLLEPEEDPKLDPEAPSPEDDPEDELPELLRSVEPVPMPGETAEEVLSAWPKKPRGFTCACPIRMGTQSSLPV